MKTILYATAISLALISNAQAAPKLTVKAQGIAADGLLAPEYAFCIPADKGHVQNGPNKNIGLSWSKGPAGTKSYAIIGVDTEVPTVFDDAGKEGKTIPASMPRQNFYHWVLVNIPASTTSIAAGADSSSASKNGKAERQMSYGLRGINDYTRYMAQSPEHKGIYAGYDGPCPPWNDERMHKYHFKVFALDVEKLPVSKDFGGEEASQLVAKHSLASGEVVGNYTLNPSVSK